MGESQKRRCLLARARPLVQAAYREISDYVDDKYKDASPAKVGDFLAKADCWIIAHALAKGGTVVTRESKVDKTSQTPKLPNVCEKFEVPFIKHSICSSS